MMNGAGRVAILVGVRIPFARQNTNYAAASTSINYGDPG